MCLDALFALLSITNRYELRLVMLKELERIQGILLQLKDLDEVSQNKVTQTLEQLNHCKKVLHSLDSKHIDRLRNIEFLNTIKLRNIHETGSYLFEIPELQYWLLQSQEQRAKQIQQWLDDFTPFKETTDFLLHLIRDAAETEECVKINGNNNVYPSISGDGYRFVIRFMQHEQVDKRAKQATDDIEFSLEACGI